MTETNVASKNALQLLKSDHKTVKELFDQFEKTKDSAAQKRIADECLNELRIHATVEEEIFYPAVRGAIEDKDGVMEEAGEEHHVAKMLIAELEEMDGDEENFEAKFTVLAENVRHHIKEEEGEMFPLVKESDLDLKALGEELLQRKQELEQEGSAQTPKDDEEEEEDEKKPRGRIGYVLLWALGIPIPLLFVIYLMRGCN